jgi:Uma2 family endonuclease
MEAHELDPTHYPDSDGQPMSDNTAQYYWIVLLKENLDVWLPDFVAGDLLWYPVQGDNQTRIGPDVLVALGRPKGPRGSYRQWEEGGVAPQLVVEVLSPNNTAREMNAKRRFYEQHGVSEYLVLDPDLDDPERAILEVWVSRDGRLQLADYVHEYQSTLLGVRFVRKEGRLSVRYPDGSPFLTTAQRKAERDALATERDALATERDALATERDASVAKAQRLAERLRALGVDPDEE